MNALEKNEFTEAWHAAVKDLQNVRAILVVSAHWLTSGTQVTAMAKPPTIHDFGGFPRALFEVEYPAPGSPELAERVAALLADTTAVKQTHDWGLDHGAWSILVHMFPHAPLPVIQLSIDTQATPEQYFSLGRALRPLRDEGILLMGSGNIVHNLRLVDWHRLNERDFAADWAREAMNISGKLLREKDWQSLIEFPNLPESMQLAINSAEHYIPLLYILGAGHDDEPVTLFNDVAVGGALSMTSLCLG